MAQKKTEENNDRCVLCGAPIMINEFTDNEALWAHNAYPLADGYCCAKCNNERVLVERRRLAKLGQYKSAPFDTPNGNAMRIV